MKEYNFTDSTGKEFERGSRTTAKKRFLKGETVYFCPDRIRPDGYFGGGLAFSKESTDKAFEQIEEEFSFYCCRPDTGLRIAFYIEVKS